ncbi:MULTISPECIES: Fur family transcriptional regulator [Nocardiopsidaceae]|uniref:Fur family transcriptional regulator n=1 Tax=Streptomonospora nanhaiensis TaxID=1323731 RepID=A0ABY6YF65_9ACTN|nr:Fur family transcriptional regulator [Streptomonospora nanhaiensis]WAE70870.1 Fur family transcriptional regulator [Streptomonospora nanhaiensis]
MPRVSQYDDVVLGALDRSTHFRSCQEIHAALGGRRSSGPGPPSLSTVYRTLHRLAQEGVLDTLHSTGGERLYRLCRTSFRHHHLLCRVCGRVEDVAQADELAAVADRVRRDSGFESLDYSFELSGVCPRCA